MKRKVPVFRVSLSSGASYEQLVEIPQVKQAVIEETVLAIKHGIKTKKKSIPLFEIAGSDCYVELKKEQWKSSLENAISFYLESEDYDKCIECRDLMNAL